MLQATLLSDPPTSQVCKHLLTGAILESAVFRTGLLDTNCLLKSAVWLGRERQTDQGALDLTV